MGDEMKITVNDNYHINFDGNNYTPFRFQAGTGETVKVAGRELVSKDKWVDSGKYFTKLSSALNWIATDSVMRGEDLTIGEFIDKLESVKLELIKACKE